MSKTSCILFDLDGTLLDSRQPIMDAMFAMMQKYLPNRFTQDEILERFGESFDETYRKFSLELANKATREQMYDTYLDYMKLNHIKNSKLFPFVQEGLTQLKLLGYQLGIVTNKQREFVLKGLEQVEIIKLFNTIVCVDDVAFGKPSPEPIIKAMNTLGVKSNQTLMVGDSRYDMDAARAAQVKCVLLEWYGQNKSGELLPDYYFTNFQDFFEVMYLQKKSAG